MHYFSSIYLADIDKFKSIQISCPSCPKHEKILFDDKHSYELHFRKAHDYEISFGCSVCDYISKKFVLLKNHFKKHIGSKKFKCNECEEEFRQKSELNFHKTTEHKLKICRKCNFEFNNFQAYLEHKESHDDLQIAKNNKAAMKVGQVGRECEICGKILMTQGGLMTHVRMHSEAPKFRCELCQKEFFQKVNLINHTKTHNIQNRSYSCSKCEKKFFEKSHLQRHQNFHNVSREFECTTCNKFYKTERCLKVHKQVHNPVHMRPFRCTVEGCSKSFLSSSKLKQHCNIHTNTRPFRCKHCSRDFTNYPNLLKHTIRRHKVDHRTGRPLDKIPDYVTNKKKKKTSTELTFGKIQDKPLVTDEISKQEQEELSNFNVIHIPDEEFTLSTSGLIERGYHLNSDSDVAAIQNYDSILMDIDQEFSDFQLLSNEDQDIEQQFSIIDTTGKTNKFIIC